MSHAHSWLPIPGEAGQYHCTCEATGYRARGGIREHKSRKPISAKLTARNRVDSGRVGGRIPEDWQSPERDE